MIANQYKNYFAQYAGQLPQVVAFKGKGTRLFLLLDLKNIHTVFEVDLMDPAPPGPKPNRCCGYNFIGDAGIDHQVSSTLVPQIAE